MTEYIYIGSTELEEKNNYFKIGKTKRDIKKRIKEYQTGRSNINEFYCLEYFPCLDCDNIETKVKKYLKPYQDKGEVYKIPLEELKEIIENIILFEEYQKPYTSFKPKQLLFLIDEFKNNFQLYNKHLPNKKYRKTILIAIASELKTELIEMINSLEDDNKLLKQDIKNFIVSETIPTLINKLTQKDFYKRFLLFSNIDEDECSLIKFNTIVKSFQEKYQFIEKDFSNEKYWIGLKFKKV